MEGTPRIEPTHNESRPQEERTPARREEDMVHISREEQQRIIDAAGRNAIVEYESRTLIPAAREPARRQLFKEKEDPVREEEGGKPAISRAEVEDVGRQIGATNRRAEETWRNGGTKQKFLFCKEILTEVVDANFRLLDLSKYDGTKDPQEHVSAFELVMNLYGHTDPINAKLFVTTLSGNSQEWFTSLPSGTIESYSQLIQNFTFHFASKKKKRRATTYLFTIRQREDESLKSFIGRFNNDIWSSIYLSFKDKIPNNTWCGEVKCNQEEAWRCYNLSIKKGAEKRSEHQGQPIVDPQDVNENKKLRMMEQIEPVEEHKEVELVLGKPEKTTRIGSRLNTQMETLTIEFLRKNTDMFAWNPSDLKGINLEIIVHRLNVDLQAKQVK
ncbi:UNVERIFIED_CONTAM: hypothetical protein Scaly_2230700 [Sesamum calycinum]|uniref:Retrotransposon gag domain-containing protein n=1 Tax=Sesamum calycinum TaxID=2727403 RepID=A0AAW2MC02_9LAMI